ncbi:hypothetical protein [Streptomyces johnsoniae]|uniref:Scaffolding protein n=1 Tax=Streptomyces johnsoniae TaxID=3075532 RepID=A0ABU2S3C6_9ACTN|nr:hypothetical protein [Streptomyces sp. DSM 41886]MDT0442319.1 hypothetical protein [Streptomyces sp. DSM 41886]
MSDGYGYSDYAEGQEQGQGSQEPKWFRDRMDKLSGEVSELKAENDRLKAEQRKSMVADSLRAKGFSPAGAQLYTGEPDKLDDWLSTHGAALAKLPTAPEGGQEQQAQEQPAGPPQTTVQPQDQQAMQQFSEAGAGAAPPAGSDAEMAAKIASLKTPEEYAEFMRTQGNAHDWS